MLVTKRIYNGSISPEWASLPDVTRSKVQHSVIGAGLALLVAAGSAAALAPTAAAAPSEQDRVVELVNEARDKVGCGDVKADPRLATAADKHSSDMASREYFDHTSPNGETFSERITDEGYPSPGAENIAMGHQTAEEVMDSWMKSEGHKDNILDCSLKTIGVGVEQSGWYWTQDFGR